MDASYDSKKGKARAADDKAPTNRAQQRQAGDVKGPTAGVQPLLLGSSLSGALRARARWLAACARIGTDEEGKPVDGEAPLAGKDDAQRRAAIAKLPPVARLFGVTGFRGLVQVDDLEVAAARRMNLTSVRIDRFSGAPVENALFTTDAFVGVDLRFRLSLRPGVALPPEVAAEDLALLEALTNDIAANGLMLGHGTNKGFGWFEEVA